MRKLLYIFIIFLVSGTCFSQNYQGVNKAGNPNTRPNTLRWTAPLSNWKERYIFQTDPLTGEPFYSKLNLRDSISALSTSYTIVAGTGISAPLVGSVYTITNTSPNIVQTISKTGSTIYLSNGGGNVHLDSASYIKTVSGTTNQITVTGTQDITISLPTSVHLAGTLFIPSAGVQFGDGGGISGATTGFIYTPSDGVFRFGDSGGGGSPSIIMGSASDGNGVRMVRNGAVLDIKDGGGSTYAGLKALTLQATTSASIPALSNLVSDGFVKTNGLTGTLSVGTAVTSINGTTNRLTATSLTNSSGSTTYTLDISSSYVGQSSITTLGTIGTGVWNGTVIGSSYGGAGTVSGILKANGSGTVSAATPTTDYTIPADLTIYAPKASPTFTGTVTIPTSFVIGATTVTTTGTQLNYLNAATGTTGTTSTNLVYSASPTLVTPILGTPQSGVATNLTGLPLTTGVTGVLPVANGGTNASSASITAFNNITGYTASGSTGTTSTNLVFSASPTFTGTIVAANAAITPTVTTTNGIDIANSTLTTGMVQQIALTSTALSSTTPCALKLMVSGANANTAVTATGINVAVSNTNATSGTNIAATFSATGATTNNIALNITGGRQLIAVAPVASANFGTLSIGSGAFDGSTSGKYVGASSSGTSLAVNEISGYSGNLMELEVAGVSKFRVQNTGVVVIASYLTTPGGSGINFQSRGWIQSPSDGVILLQNNANTDFTRLQFGNTTSSFPAIKRSSATLAFRLADDSADCDISAAKITASGNIIASGSASTIRPKVFTVAGLPGTPTQGDICVASDLLAPTFGATAVGGGAVVLPVMWNGSNWVVF